MNYDIYHLNGVELSAPLCYQLQPFISAYRPHEPAPLKSQLDKINYIPKESPCSMANIIDTTKGINGANLQWLEIKRKYNQSNRNHRSYY